MSATEVWLALRGEDGRVVCERCPGPPHERTGLTLEGLKVLKAYQRLDIEALAALRIVASVEAEVEVALRDFVRGALEREARSLAFLDEVRHVPVASAVQGTPVSPR